MTLKLICITVIQIWTPASAIWQFWQRPLLGADFLPTEYLRITLTHVHCKRLKKCLLRNFIVIDFSLKLANTSRYFTLVFNKEKDMDGDMIREWYVDILSQIDINSKMLGLLKIIKVDVFKAWWCLSQDIVGSKGRDCLGLDRDLCILCSYERDASRLAFKKDNRDNIRWWAFHHWEVIIREYRDRIYAHLETHGLLAIVSMALCRRVLSYILD